MMQLFSFAHEPAVKSGCCNNMATVTYWMAPNREEALQDINKHTDDGTRPHGNCSMCLAELLASEDYEITRGDT